LSVAHENDLVLVIARDGKRFMFRLRAGDRFHSHRGFILHDDLIGKPLGREVQSHLHQPFMILRPSLHDLLMNIKRVSQIIYPKDIGQILLKLDAGNGRRIIEAGTGSGALTIALAHAVQPDGMVYSYEAREDMVNVARRNIQLAGMQEYVRLTQRNIQEGFDETDVDAVFLDVREPWDYMPQAMDALVDGGFFGALVPTTNQVSWLLAEMARHPLTSIEVLEILVRKYKPVAARLRPEDRMVAHTGFLLFARKYAAWDRTQPEGSQEQEQLSRPDPEVMVDTDID
jgi:tRNA (adenine57-N1/adenine58-N1)-methyltransferase